MRFSAGTSAVEPVAATNRSWCFSGFHLPSAIGRCPPSSTYVPAAAKGSGCGAFFNGLPALQTYGAASPGAYQHEWRIGPNHGGLTLVGNAGFSLTLRSTLGTAPGFQVYALDRAHVPMPQFGITSLLDPATMVFGGVLPPQPTVTVPLSVPPNPLLAGMSVDAQARLLEPLGNAATAGLQIAAH